MTRFDPSGPLSGTLQPPPDKSISHRAALIARDGGGGDRGRRLPRRRRHEGDAGACEFGGSAHELDARLRPTAGADSRAWGFAAPGSGGRSTSPNAGTPGPARMLPGWLAGQGAGSWTLDGDESIRRRPVDRVAEPLRLMGAEVECREGRLPPLRVERRRPARDRLPAARRERPGEVVRPARRAPRRGRDPRDRAGDDPGPHRAHAEGGRREGRVGRACGPRPVTGGGPARRITIRPVERLQPWAGFDVPGDFSSAAFPSSPRRSCPAARCAWKASG